MTLKVTGASAEKGYTIRGCDDWLVFVTDADGAWFYLNTEGDPGWMRIRDPWSPIGVLWVGQYMLANGTARPKPIDDDCLENTIALFGTVQERHSPVATKTCDHCGLRFSVGRGQGRRRDARYCSDLCRYEHNNQLRARRASA